VNTEQKYWINIFKQLFQMAASRMTVCFTQLWGMAIFDHKHLTR